MSSDKFLKIIANKPFDDEIDPLGGIGNITIEKPTSNPKPVSYSQKDKNRRSVALKLVRELETMSDTNDDDDPHATKTVPNILKAIRKNGTDFVVSGQTQE